MVLLDFLDCGVEFLSLGAIDEVREFMPDECLISRDNNYFQIIYFLKLRGLGFPVPVIPANFLYMRK